MTYKVELIHTEEGYSIGCPELPGCWSEGQTEEEAIANIKEAISDYLAVVKETNSAEAYEKKLIFVDVPDTVVDRNILPPVEAKPFKVRPSALQLPEGLNLDKISSLLETLEGNLHR